MDVSLKLLRATIKGESKRQTLSYLSFIYPQHIKRKRFSAEGEIVKVVYVWLLQISACSQEKYSCGGKVNPQASGLNTSLHKQTLPI